MAQKVNPRDIPAAGRYDMTVISTGEMKVGEDKVPAVVCVIDNGPHAYKRLSFPTTGSYAEGDRLSAHVEPHASALVQGVWTRVALDYVPPAGGSNPRIRYLVSDEGAPAAERTIAIRDRKAKFHRRSL